MPATPSLATAPPAETAPAQSGQHQDFLAKLLDHPHLPTPPALALQIIDKTSKPECQIKEITRLIQQDPGLCAKVLQTVNSSLFGLARPVAAMDRAVMVLGLKSFRSLVLSLSLPNLQNHGAGTCWKNWRQSVAGAVIARDLAKWLKQPNIEDDLVAGLLRDLGVTVLQQIFPSEYQQVEAHPSQDALAHPCPAEEELFTVHHAEVSACLLESWRLPAEIHVPIRYHHHPNHVPKDAAAAVRQRAWLLYLASGLAELDRVSPRVMTELVRLANDRFGIDQKNLGSFLSQVVPKITDLARVLHVDIGQCPNYAEIVASGSAALVQLSVEAARDSFALANGSAARSAVPQETASGHDTFTPTFDLSWLEQGPPKDGVLNGYQIKALLGRGAMGVVFKGWDPVLNRFVAIKTLNRDQVVQAESRDRFLREARAAAAIQHDNVVAIHAVSEIHGLPFLIMEYLEGVSLEERLKKEGPFPVAEVIRCGKQIALGLQAAHERQLIHRDIKPANILQVKAAGTVKITDFGLAHMKGDVRLTRNGALVGTPFFMAPEQFLGEPFDQRTDLFSLGSLLYNLCTGKVPFAGPSLLTIMKQVCEGAPTPIHDLRADVPQWLQQLIARLHAKKPAHRLASAAEVVRLLDQQST